MRNHDQKARDMARAVLPSTSRRGARKAKRAVHAGERARLRLALHDARTTVHPDDVQVDLHWLDRSGMIHVVAERRSYDKVAPLLRWAEAVVERDAALAAASSSDRQVFFRNVLGVGLVADHALFHLGWSVLRLETDLVPRWTHQRRRVEGLALAALVQALVDAGMHGPLNRALKAERHRMARPLTRRERVEAKEAGDSPWWRERVEGRLLAGAHDVVAFAADIGVDHLAVRVVHDLHVDLL
ncbi:hypothetical protein HC251_24095 [Iamia sp. SCSIO 61187]|uniref:hypothetical protein n=1 Tax=Iamia sp. SCSIO 61187 TaxID=2722752 RepID=UPI001C63657C|nr:hypothetical protein [Iamia sp. SCSIO 61187]QYG95204.1 hypothetical protein HC251_24095 [Iamia sp. SCSIO 61187]